MVKIKANNMTAREFFYLVASMRQCQREYFQTRDQLKLRACKKLEQAVDDEISRVKDLENRS